ncbi:MAG: membrane protein insertion efficiency factor YidD [Acidobacteria bacterium]|nr:membrane protein insertion efficiency factor YidD [Acidobacteriota bacterium]
MKQLINTLPITAIKIYQKTKRRKHSKCLHYPSCSNYALLAYDKYNIFKATRKIYKRYQDCNPFSNRPYIDYP